VDLRGGTLQWVSKRGRTLVSAIDESGYKSRQRRTDKDERAHHLPQRADLGDQAARNQGGNGDEERE
jgi:hypothetical protein